MFKIGDFSKLGQVSVRMLRHYDQLGLLKPDHIDKFTGYRYYTAGQLAHLNRIIFFKDLGFSLQQIKDLLSNNLPNDQLRGMLMMKQVELEREVQDSHARLARVEARLQQIEQEGKPTPYEVTTKSVEEMVIATVRQLVPKPQDMDYYCKQMYTTLYRGLGDLGISPRYPEVTFYHNEEYPEQDLDVEAAVVVSDQCLTVDWEHPHLTIRTAPAEKKVAALIYEGPFPKVVSAVLALLNWIGINEWRISGPLRELHLSGPAHVKGQLQEKAVLELQIPIKT
ncbi:MAG: MerR family transcriptional regulator [Desulfobacterales bacterium]|jgi:DNA-binding transcriptional MerR regulator